MGEEVQRKLSPLVNREFDLALAPSVRSCEAKVIVRISPYASSRQWVSLTRIVNEKLQSKTSQRICSDCWLGGQLIPEWNAEYLTICGIERSRSDDCCRLVRIGRGSSYFSCALRLCVGKIYRESQCTHVKWGKLFRQTDRQCQKLPCPVGEVKPVDLYWCISNCSLNQL